MDPEITDTVTDWESVAVESGYAGLRSLVADDFSGAVTTGVTWAFLLNGRIVGVFDGDVGEFSDADLTAYRAPDVSLPLLFAMRETGGETRGQYYTQETPLAEVDRRLEDGNFTGYVELSENVLSGDYYVVYHGGRSMSVAFVGASRRLVTGDEAFDLAADEVGIYDVNTVDITVVEVPESESPTTTMDGESEDGDAPDGEDESTGPVDSIGTGDVTFDGRPDHEVGDDDADAAGADPDAAGRAATAAESDAVSGGDPASEPGSGSTASEPGTEARTDASETGPERGDAGSDHTDGHGDDGMDDQGDHDDQGDRDDQGDHDDRDDHTRVLGGGAEYGDSGGDENSGIGAEATNGSGRGAETEPPRGGAAPGAAVEERAAASEGDADDDQDHRADSTLDAHDDRVDATADRDVRDGAETEGSEADVFTAERRWRKTRRIPALDPDESIDRNGAAAVDPDREADATTRAAGGTDGADERERGGDTTREGDGTHADPPSGDDTERRRLADQLAATEAERDELAATVEDLESRLAAADRDREEYRERIADLEAEIDRLRGAIDGGESSAVGSTGDDLAPAAARAGTNLFVRYRSKADPTLADARSGDAAQEAVVENLRVEYHTTFDDGSVTVDGRPYEEFLRGSTEWGFVTWVVEDLLYEIGRSGHRTDMEALFDRIPEIDRVQFDGEVAVTVEEGGETSHENRTFDLVFRDSMGDPLFVADVDTGRNATTAGMVGSLIDGARAVGGSKETFGGAFFVTTAFFEPEALDAVAEETGGGFLSRTSAKSFVKLSRKQGYHLCLVEARGDEFHLAVPEL